MTEQLAENMMKKMDKNADGKVSIIEMFDFFVKNPVYIFLAVAIISITPISGFIRDGIVTGIWNISDLLTTITGAIVAFVFYMFSKTSNKENETIINTIKTKFMELLNDKDSVIKEYADRIVALTSSDNTNKISIQLKDQEINYLRNGICITPSGKEVKYPSEELKAKIAETKDLKA